MSKSLEMQRPMPIRLRLLGRLSLACASTSTSEPTPIRLSTRKTGALLAYLGMAADHSAGREELATLLWGDCTNQQARQSLRQALVSLRKELGSADLLMADTEMVRLSPGLWAVDAREFEELSRSADPESLARAARLFGGEFLAGLHLDQEGFDDWAIGQRQRMLIAAARICEIYASRPVLVTDRGDDAIALAEKLLALDPLREDWQRIALTLYARYRGKNEALAQADVFAGMLLRELAVKPEAATRQLVERIRADEIAPVPMPERREAIEVSKPDPIRLERPLPDRLDVAAPASPPIRQTRHYSIRSLAATAVGAAALGAALLSLYWPPTKASAPVNAPAPVSAAVADYWRGPSQAPDGAKDIIPIAVLPMTALGDTGASTQLIADMMTDDLVNMLSRVPSFRVISRQTTNRYQGQPIDVATIGAELHVRYVLEGSIRVQDNGLRVNLQLSDPASRLPVWSERIERDGADRYAIRDEIVSRIARELQIDMAPIEGARRAADHSADGSAYLGWAALHAAVAKTNLDQYRKAEAYFLDALGRDPGNVAATMGLGSYHANVAVQRLDRETAKHFAKAEELLNEAVRRDPRNSTAEHYLGVLYQGVGRLRDGLEHFRKAVDLNPSNAGSHAHIGHALARLGEAEAGIQHIRYAMRLSPKDPALAIWHEFLGNAQLELSSYPEAIESFRQSATLAPQYPRAWAGLTAAYALNGDDAGAKASLSRLETFATGLDAKQIIDRFGRRKDSRLNKGLRMAVAPDPWQSPPMPSGEMKKAASPRPTSITSIGVLRFTTPDAGGASTHVADIVTDDLTDALSRVPTLRVISRQTMRRYTGDKVDVAAIGDELKVQYLLEGMVRQHDDKLRVTVHLIDPASRLTVWTDRIEQDANAADAVRDEIVIRLGRKLQFEVYRREGERNAQDPGPREILYQGWSLLFDANKVAVLAGGREQIQDSAGNQTRQSLGTPRAGPISHPRGGAPAGPGLGRPSRQGRGAPA